MSIQEPPAAEDAIAPAATVAALPAVASTEPPQHPTGRLMSVDALRGFDMFWIVGAGHLVGALHKVSDAGPATFLATQLSHVEWEGFRFYDLIFPLFVFLVGVSIVFSLDKIVAREGKRKAYGRVFRRFVLLFVVGIVYSGGLSNDWADIRVLGVLQRIALCYLFASVLYLNFRARGLAVATVLLLGGYWAFLSFVPVPIEPAMASATPPGGQGGISFAMNNNWANYIDFHLLPGRLYNTYWDPEGLLSTLPAICTALFGVFAGLLLKSQSSASKKAAVLLLGGAALVVLGSLWGLQFPVIKKIWTSSYVLVAGGYSSILLGLFYLVVDVWGFRKWTTPFLWIGSNALTIYLAWRFVDFGELARLFVGGPVSAAIEPYGDLLVAVVALALALLFVRFLYKKRIFLRL